MIHILWHKSNDVAAAKLKTCINKTPFLTCWKCEHNGVFSLTMTKSLQQIIWSKEIKECMNVRLHCPCFTLLLSTIARINSQWHSIASAALLELVSANQWSELFAGFCSGWVTCLEGKLKFALQDATTPPPLVCLTFSCSHHPSVSSILPAVLSALLSLATEDIQADGLKCVCIWQYQKESVY